MVRSSYHADEQVNEAAKKNTVLEKNSYNKIILTQKFIINFLLSDIDNEVILSCETII